MPPPSDDEHSQPTESAASPSYEAGSQDKRNLTSEQESKSKVHGGTDKDKNSRASPDSVRGPREYTKRQSRRRPWPESQSRKSTAGNSCRSFWVSGWISSCWNRWSYSYMRPILIQGKRQFREDGSHLTQDDLFDVPDDLQANELVKQFWQHYREKPSLIRALWKVAAPSYIPAGLWELLYVTARVSLPLSLRQLLIVLENNPGQNVVQEGLPFAFTLALGALVGALAQNRTVYLSTKSGIIIRAALTSAIYEHSLRLTPEGRMGLTVGEVTNLVAVDTQKLYDVMLEGHNLWSCPIILIVVSALLWVIMGPELVLGVATLILFLPLVKLLVGRMLKIRRGRSALTDVRINILTSMLQGVHVTKINHYESKIESLVGKVRKQEMKLLRKELGMWGWVLACAVVSPLVATAISFSFYSLVQDGNIMTAADAFSALLLFSILRFPINLTARLIGKIAQSTDSARRISKFLLRETRRTKTLHNNGNITPTEDLSRVSRHTVVDLKQGTFTLRDDGDFPGLLDSSDDDASAIEESEKQVASSTRGMSHDISDVNEANCEFFIRDVNFEVRRSNVLAVIGKVGSGKTLLLRALLGELPVSQDTVMTISGKLSYASQKPFILNASLRENVLFGSDFDELRYEATLDACCLRHDIQRLGPAKDLTEIGERGVTLSGGQKQRIALARAIFSSPDICLLDDCFSALDSTTASAVFDNLFAETVGFLRESGTILVTHAVHFLPRVDSILALSEGSPTFYGTWSELHASDGEASKIIRALESEKKDTKRNTSKRGKLDSIRIEGLREMDGYIMTLEERRYGLATLWVWVEWFRRAGGWFFFLTQVGLLILGRGFYVASDWWLALWADGAYNEQYAFGRVFAPQSDGVAAQTRYVAVYGAIIFLSMVATVGRCQWAVAGGARCAEAMFDDMMHRVLRAPMSYFETTPLGRILNRFTYDVEVLDLELSVSMTGFMMSASWLIASIVVMAAVLPWMILGIIPMLVVYFVLQNFYRMSGPDLQRLDATSRSPIQASLSEGLEGAVTIRAYEKEDKFANMFRSHVDNNSAAMMNFLAAQRWLGLRVELLGTTISFALSLVIVCANDRLGIPPGLVGLVVQWSIFLTTALNFFLMRFSESEARITSIERIQETTKLPQEAAWETDPSIDLDPNWPKSGALEFDQVSMRYRSNLPLSLDSVSFKLPSGTRCGVVGRTGAGKTSLTVALFRLVEIESGRCLLDGVDVSKIGLSDLRGRPNCVRMIPQDPVLFAGSLRDCLDPFGSEKDETILEALRAVNHQGATERGLDILDDVVEEGGSNFSVGERQLLCLARAIVEQPRVLVLDEATASIDGETDAFIQQMLRTRFQGTTLLTIAHRIHTIIDYDVVLVMDEARCAEFGPPRELLKNDNGIFSSLVEATGRESAAALRKTANSCGN